MNRFVFLALLSALAPTSVAAQGYPSKPIHIILPAMFVIYCCEMSAS
jgi:hypothetical protein